VSLTGQILDHVHGDLAGQQIRMAKRKGIRQQTQAILYNSYYYKYTFKNTLFWTYLTGEAFRIGGQLFDETCPIVVVVNHSIVTVLNGIYFDPFDILRYIKGY